MPPTIGAIHSSAGSWFSFFLLLFFLLLFLLLLFLLLLFHPPEGGLVVRWRIIVVFYCCFTRLKAGFLLAMLLAVELRRSGTSLAKHRRLTQPMSSVGAAHRYLFCYYHPISFLLLFLLLLFHPPEGGLVVGWCIVVVFYCCFTRLKAGFLLAMLLAVELRRSGTSLFI
jgi:hypothetical protein